MTERYPPWLNRRAARAAPDDYDPLRNGGYLLDPTAAEQSAWWAAHPRHELPYVRVRKQYGACKIDMDCICVTPFPDAGGLLVMPLLGWASDWPGRRAVGVMGGGRNGAYVQRARPDRARLAARLLVQLWRGEQDETRQVLAAWQPEAPAAAGRYRIELRSRATTDPSQRAVTR